MGPFWGRGILGHSHMAIVDAGVGVSGRRTHRRGSEPSRRVSGTFTCGCCCALRGPCGSPAQTLSRVGAGAHGTPARLLAFERPLRARLLRVCCAFAARLSAPRSNSLGAGGRVRGSDGRAHGRRDGSAGRVGRRTAGGRTSGLQARMAGSDRGAGGRADVSDERVGVAAGRMVPSAMQALTRFAIVLADGTRAS
jgi:hypothetical protein